MNTAIKTKTSQLGTENTESLLSQAIKATKQTSPDTAKKLIKALAENALEGTIQWDKNVIKTLNNTINAIDEKISQQLSKILHNNIFSELEGSWRGLQYLINNSNTNEQLKIRMLSLTKNELKNDLEKAGEFDQSFLFKQIYEHQFGMPGGQPYAVLLANYEFSHLAHDVSLLKDLSSVAAAAFCPVITSVNASCFGFNDWTELAKPRDLKKIFDSTEYAAWKSFRESEDSRFITLTLPRVLARLPYGKLTNPVQELNIEETSINPTNNGNETAYCWMNACFALGQRLTEAFTEHGFCTAIRGAEAGGKVSNLPLHVFKSDDGDIDSTCPTEVGITDRREAELSGLGFLPICHYKDTDYAVFFSAATAQKPKIYDQYAATANAQISARLPYIMATSRFAHYLKVMARDKIGSFMETADVEQWLNRWIMQYVNANPNAKQDLKAKYPLAEAKVSVEAIPGRPGAYQAVAWLRPWLQLEELTTSLRLVAEIPTLK